MTTAWIDATAGASGDMLLGALAAAGADVDAPVRSLGLGLGVRTEPVRRAGLAATRAVVDVPDGPQPPRTLRDVLAVLDAAPLPDGVRITARRVFTVLAEAEAAVHAGTVEEVHFHEVGALDALADVVGTVAGCAALGLDRVLCSPVGVGGGSTAPGAHGVLPVPAPAVLELLLRGPLSVGASPGDGERLTPTGAALLSVLATETGPLPPGGVDAVGVGAGARDDPARPNVLRLVLLTGPAAPAAELRLLACTVDDADPRSWPAVLAELLQAGALDAWLTPVLGKKGRPAQVLSALCQPADAAALRRVMFLHTPTLGVREHSVARTALDREFASVDVAGRPVRIKLGRLDGRVVNAEPEWEDVLGAAAQLAVAPKQVLARARAAAAALLEP